METETLFIGRQPILDREEKLFGYELLFRSADTLSANVTDYFHAAVTVVLNTLSTFGITGLLGRYKGFFNVNTDLLMSETLELLPREHVVIELLESIEISDEVVERCRTLKERGFSLALDDHICQKSYEPLYEIVDIIKLDVLALSPAALQDSVERLRGKPLRLLAEKVETPEQFARCMKMGFDLFQGYYFAKPVVLKQRRMDISKLTLMKLLQLINKDAETGLIEKTFKENPSLTYNLLRLVNSVAMGLREKIRSLRHAIAMLGREQLKRWIVLALFASSDERGFCSPLLEMAAMRGRLMELLVKSVPLLGRGPEYAETAFMTGVLSLINVILDIPIGEATRQLNLADDISQALLGRKGILGDLLAMAEKLEQADFRGVALLLSKCHLSFADLQSAQMDAIRWTNSLQEFESSDMEPEHPEVEQAQALA